jgi:hypothetical protein
MGLGVIFAVVISSAPAAQSALTAAEAHYRALPAFQARLTTTTTVLPNNPTFRHRLPPAFPVTLQPHVQTGDISFQNPGMMSYVAHVGQFTTNVAIEGDVFRQLIGGGSIPFRVLEMDARKDGPDAIWSLVHALFVAVLPLSSRFDFEVETMNATGTVVSGRPVLAGTRWVRVEVEIAPTSEVRRMKIVTKNGFAHDLVFAAFAAIVPPGRTAFVPVVP